MKLQFKKYLKILVAFFFMPLALIGQQGIGTTTPNASSVLDVTSTSKGVLVPRLTQTQIDNFSNPVAGLQVYNTTKNCIYTYTGSAWLSEKKFISNMVSLGDTVILENLMVRVPSSGNASAQLAFKSGSTRITGTSFYSNTNQTVGTTVGSSYGAYMRQSEFFSSSFTYFQSGLSFATRGNVQQIWFTDETNWKFYKINVVNGISNQLLIEIEEFN
jgi:hypothetical protein